MKRYPPLAGGWGWTVEKTKLGKTKPVIKFMRFTDTQVLKDIQNVIAEIEKNVEEFESQDVGNLPKSTPSPRQRGTSFLYLLKNSN